jgi:hypothetical protein
VSEIEAIKVEIHTLTERARVLSDATDWWNGKMVLSLVLAAVAAVLVVLTTVMALKRAGQTNDVQTDLIRAKDRQLALELRDRDVQIAGAMRLAADANKAPEDERMARAELEANVAWRSLSDSQRNGVRATLARFSGQLVECSFLSSDTEAFSFSADIAATLRLAHWQVIPPNPNVFSLKETSLPTTASPIETIDFGVEVTSTSDTLATSAAHTFVAEFERVGFDAHFKQSTQRPQASRVWIMVQHRPLGPQGEAKLRALHKPK